MKAPTTTNTNKGNNPFDQKVKPAFDDLEDIGFELDSDRPIEFNNKKNQPEQVSKANDPFTDKTKKKDDDNGLIADNDFGDDFDDYYNEDFEDDDKKEASKKKDGKLEDDIFNKSTSNDAKKTEIKKEESKQAE